MVYSKQQRRVGVKTQEQAAKEQMQSILTGSCCEGAPQGESCDGDVNDALAEGKVHP